MALTQRLAKAFNAFMETEETAALPEVDTAALQERTDNLETISEWIYKTAKEVDVKTSGLTSKSENDGLYAKCFDFQFNCGIDIIQFDREDLKTLQPALYELHDVCKKHNIAVDMQGFDLLPRESLTTSGSLSFTNHPGKFLISIDGRREYNHWINPFSEKELEEARQKYKAPVSSAPKQ